jgi:single-stranded DNA-binding protein
MYPISLTVTGRLGDAPRTFPLRDGSEGVELRLAVEIPSRTPGGDGSTRWMKVVAYGVLATRVAQSVSKGDRVTVIADDIAAEAWTTRDERHEPRGGIRLRALDISASMAFDTLRTGLVERRAARAAAANGEPTSLPAHEQAEAQVLRGVTTTS